MGENKNKNGWILWREEKLSNLFSKNIPKCLHQKKTYGTIMR